MRRALFTLCFLVVVGCSKTPTTPTGTGSSGGGNSASSADLQFCVDETNRYRAMRSRPALSRSSALESFAADAARNDGQSKVGHQHFQRTNGGGLSRAENELPWWPMNRFADVRDVMRQGIAGFYSEGPGGGHFENMTGTYTQLGCGVYLANGEITVTQEFR